MTQSPSLAAAKRAAAELDELFEVPQWSALAAGLRPPPKRTGTAGAWCSQAGVAARGSSVRGTKIQGNHSVPQDGPRRKGNGQITSWAQRWGGTVDMPIFPVDAH